MLVSRHRFLSMLSVEFLHIVVYGCDEAPDSFCVMLSSRYPCDGSLLLLPFGLTDKEPNSSGTARTASTQPRSVVSGAGISNQLDLLI